MVHRAPDSRLLSSLSSHESTYHKHLLQLVDVYAQSALSALAAYASAAPPGTARGIMGVAGSLAGADEALRRYAGAVDEWRARLEEIREAEEDVGRVVRDRDILVTRLIKISKSQKPTRDSFIATISPAYGQPEPSASSSSLHSHASSPSLISANTKLSAAQAELQACETTLASKEAALDKLRVSAVREGLMRRCKAMVECGWVWGEMGKEGLRALEELEKDKSPEKPLPQPNGQAGSDLSSVGPSQSASQIFSPNGENTSSRPTSPSPQLHIPPAHQISEFAHPPMERRITEETSQDLHEDTEPSDEETDERPVEVVENKPFEKPAKVTIAPPEDESPHRKRFGFRPQHARMNSGSTVSVSQSMPAVVTESHDRDRTRKSSLFGRLFRGSSTNAGLSPYGAKEGKEGKWKTRTSENVRRVGRRGEDSDDEDVPSTSTQPVPHRPRFGFRRASEDSYAGGAPARPNPRPGLGAAHPALGGGGGSAGPSSGHVEPKTQPKLKKRRSRTIIVDDSGAGAYMSDGGVAGVGSRAKKASVKGRGAAPSPSTTPGPSRASTVRSASVTPDARNRIGDVEVTVVRSASSASRSGNGTLARPVSRGNLARGPVASKSAGANLSRDNSVTTNTSTSSKTARRASGPATWSSGSAPAPFPSAGPSRTDAGRGESLMAIVEGAARERRASLNAAQNGGMYLPKASDRIEVILPAQPKPTPAPAPAPSVKSSGPARPTPVKAQTVGAATGVAVGTSLYLPTAPKAQNGSALYLPTAPKLHTTPDADKPVASTSALFLPSASAYTSSPTTSNKPNPDGLFLPSASAYSIDRSPPIRTTTSEPAKSRQANGHAALGIDEAHVAALHTPAHRAMASAVPLKSALRTRSPSPLPPAAGPSMSTSPPPAPAMFVPSAPGPIVLPPTPPPVVASAPPTTIAPQPQSEPTATARLVAPSPYDPTRRHSLADSEVSSISSYETGRESFDSASEGEGTVAGDGGSSTGTIDAVPPVPAKEPVIVAPTPINGSTSTLVREVQAAKEQGQDEDKSHLAVPGGAEWKGGSDVSSGTASSSGSVQVDAEGRPVLDGDGKPVRRKSVRMSLKPTFSPTPPALYEDDMDNYWTKPGEDDGEDSERSSEERGGSKEGGGKDSGEDRWRDSSDEDETYQKARLALKKLRKRW